MMSEELCVFGEVLFDVFPDGYRVLGGASSTLHGICRHFHRHLFLSVVSEMTQRVYKYEKTCSTGA